MIGELGAKQAGRVVWKKVILAGGEERQGRRVGKVLVPAFLRQRAVSSKTGADL